MDGIQLVQTYSVVPSHNAEDFFEGHGKLTRFLSGPSGSGSVGIFLIIKPMKLDDVIVALWNAGYRGFQQDALNTFCEEHANVIHAYDNRVFFIIGSDTVGYGIAHAFTKGATPFIQQFSVDHRVEPVEGDLYYVIGFKAGD